MTDQVISDPLTILIEREEVEAELSTRVQEEIQRQNIEAQLPVIPEEVFIARHHLSQTIKDPLEILLELENPTLHTAMSY